MRILGIESAAMVASAAITDSGRLIAEYTVDYQKTHSQTLLPMIDEIVRMTETDLEKIDGIAVSAGPGSFTGLRIGAATAKGLGLALGKPLLHIPTLEAMAWQLWGSDGLICPIMDARRGQVYGAVYDCREGVLPTEVLAPAALDLEEFLRAAEEKASAGAVPRRLLFLGDGVETGAETISRVLSAEYAFAPAHLNRQRAGAVAALGECYLRLGRTETAEEFAPDYLRISQAERVRQEKEAAAAGAKEP